MPRVRHFVATLILGVTLTGCSMPAAPDGGRPSPTAAPATTGAPSLPSRPSSAPPVERQTGPPASAWQLVEVRRISGNISPKSVTATGTGLVFAQNMMYRHTVTVYDRTFSLVATISDEVRPSDFGHDLEGTYRGAPVEAAPTPDGGYVYVSNYSMYGRGFREGKDTCSPQDGYPDSFVYRIDTATLRIDQVIEVGAVPKYLAVTPDGATLLVTNWCSYDLSVVDTATAAEIERIPIGRYPRGIAVDPGSGTAWIAVMGSTHLVAVDLHTRSTRNLAAVGGGPRHLQISPDGTHLYVTVNGDGLVAKVDVATGATVARVRTGRAPRSAVLSADGSALYVVNYESGTVSKVATAEMKVLQTVQVCHHPIGVTRDEATRQLWVACYAGTIVVFQDGRPDRAPARPRSQ
jgi:YVTN family beta-propeller protein